MNRHFGREAHAAGFGSRLRNNADNHLIERAVALACLLVLAIGVFLVMQPFLSALLWGIILTISTWPLHVRLRRALGGRTGTSAAILTLAACAIFLIPLALLGQNLAENVAQLAARLQEWRNNNVSEPPSWVAPLPLLGSRLHQFWSDLAAGGVEATAKLELLYRDGQRAAAEHGSVLERLASWRDPVCWLSRWTP